MLEKLLTDYNIDSALLFNSNGVLIDSSNLDKPQTLSAMSNIIMDMCQGLVEELNEKTLTQVIIKTQSLLIIANKLDGNQYLMVVTSDITKLGLLLKILENFKIN
ncbi:conserved hypothetical protein [Flavobacterium sp. 9AF]|uniref:roadblock/LC7 domain-containing protein n=1 Tax=Flavobacterium sp. 9AF TaxID=2653142 RepID=UPI0012F2C384|nr:roadblock/LC7 domain-containing protein [Flavobacterium sp. 9AF]VXB45972.1 conserved hypothetical protein [Flavobacterium sp. 9AF]